MGQNIIQEVEAEYNNASNGNNYINEEDNGEDEKTLQVCVNQKEEAR